MPRVTAKAKAKYGGLSTAQRTIKLSVASVEMTVFWIELERTDNDKYRSRSLRDDKRTGNGKGEQQILRCAQG
jgi:hypothetical protein